MRGKARRVVGPLALAASLAGCTSRVVAGAALPTVDAEIEVDGWTRTYRLHAPPGLDARRPAPLLVVLHGGGASGASVEEVTGFSRIAERERFIAVYPDGIGTPGLGFGRAWNAGDCCGRPQVFGVDEGRFVRALIASVRARLPVDPDRVFLVGYSNGAMLAYRLGVELADLLAGIAPYAGTMPGRGPPSAPRFDARPPARPVSMIAVHGTADPRVPYAGKEKGEGLDVAFAQAGRFWAVADGCHGRARRRTERGGAVIVDEYAPCAAGSAVTQVTLVGWDHEWPGPANTGELAPGDPLRGYDAAEAIWAFFAAHPRSGSPSSD